MGGGVSRGTGSLGDRVSGVFGHGPADVVPERDAGLAFERNAKVSTTGPPCSRSSLVVGRPPRAATKLFSDRWAFNQSYVAASWVGSYGSTCTCSRVRQDLSAQEPLPQHRHRGPPPPAATPRSSTAKITLIADSSWCVLSTLSISEEVSSAGGRRIRGRVTRVLRCGARRLRRPDRAAQRARDVTRCCSKGDRAW